MVTFYTRRGHRARIKVRNTIIKIMTNPAYEGMPQSQIAALVGIHVRTLRDYLTEELWDEIKSRRLEVVGTELDIIDKAIYRKAAQGDIQAAKLIYARWDRQRQQQETDPTQDMTLEELDAEIKRLQRELDKT